MPESILERIRRQIDAADFVIAEMTGKNPNVFYEVGYAHAKDKLCTLLTQEPEDIPFDLQHHRHLVYGGSIQTLKARLKTEISWLKEELTRNRAEPFTFLLNRLYGTLITESWKADAQVELTLDIRNQTNKRTADIEAIYFYTGPNWKFRQGEEECPSTESKVEEYKLQHFVKSPLPRLSPGAWAQLKLGCGLN